MSRKCYWCKKHQIASIPTRYCQTCNKLASRRKTARLAIAAIYFLSPTLECDDCGYNFDPRMFCFHHDDGRIARNLRKLGSYRVPLAESTKSFLQNCEPVCYNCSYERQSPSEDFSKVCYTCNRSYGDAAFGSWRSGCKNCKMQRRFDKDDRDEVKLMQLQNIKHTPQIPSIQRYLQDEKFLYGLL